MKCSCTIDLEDEVRLGLWTLQNVRLMVEFSWVDFGIGSYEYWGARGFDSRMGAEDLEVVGIDFDRFPGIPPDKEIINLLNVKLFEDEEFADLVYSKAEPDDNREPEYDF